MRTRFIIRRARTNQAGLCPINCRITVKMIRANEFAVGLLVDPNKWDSKTQRLKGSSLTAMDVNRRLDIIKSELEEIYLSARARGTHLSADQIKDIYNGVSLVGCSISKLSKQFLEELILRERSTVTTNRYKRCFAYLTEYLGKDYDVSAVQKKEVSGFWVWLKSRGYHNDYCNKIVQSCIGLFRYAIREGHIDSNPFSGVSLEWKKELDITCLDPREIESIKMYDWSERLQLVADSFLFMCYTGLHIGDYRDVRQESVYEYDGHQFMKIRRVKTNVEATFPLTDYAQFLIAKYGGVDKLPHISPQKMNDYLKIIAEKVDINKNLTNKIARKTFTNMCLNDFGFSPEVVATMLGHTTTRQIRHYGAIKEKRILTEWRLVKE
ncbi:site-specific integrase [Dyadobacter chenwenxiniae]|uniref:Site-specific integrase n=2 Tax=Dyadobacter chenwenxiniae TaxID=2906456 RepID=A0A9X1PEX9_9BACT|nr:site-specific integrase [Dyadobacter chenwenxiniae]UON85709.1 site-specific integrase [Dyadobacter chenwenxiniae]